MVFCFNTLQLYDMSLFRHDVLQGLGWSAIPRNLPQAFHAARNPDVFPRLQDRQIQLRGALPPGK